MTARALPSVIVRTASVLCVVALLTLWSGVDDALGYWHWSSTTPMRIAAADVPASAYTIVPASCSNGSISPSTTQTVGAGGRVAFTITPAAGYRVEAVWIDGVSVGPVDSYLFADVAANHTISATFSVQSFTLRYRVAGCKGSIVGSCTQVVDYGSSGTTVTAVATEVGYRFLRWSDSGSTNAARQDTGVTGDIVATASFANTYTVSFVSAGATIKTLTEIVYNTAVGQRMPAAPTREGYVFAGWNTAPDGSGLPFGATTRVKGALTVFAQWVAKVHVLTYRAADCGGSIVGSSTQAITYGANGTTVTATPTKAGYRFVKWSDNGSTDPVRQDRNVMGNINAIATFSNVFTIRFDSNGGSSVAPITQACGTPVTRPCAPTRTGYTFVGWYADPSLGTPYRFGVMPGSDTTLYAKWAVRTCSISFETFGGSTVATITQAVGSAVATPVAPTRPGYSFVGWYDSPRLDVPYAFTTMPASSITVYARWTKNHGRGCAEPRSRSHLRPPHTPSAEATRTCSSAPARSRQPRPAAPAAAANPDTNEAGAAAAGPPPEKVPAAPAAAADEPEPKPAPKAAHPSTATPDADDASSAKSQ